MNKAMIKVMNLCSTLCIILGVSAIAAAIFLTPSPLIVMVLLLMYFVGIPYLFARIAPSSEMAKLSSGKLKPQYELRFWALLSVGIGGSVVVAGLFYKFFRADYGAAIIVALGTAAMLTSFVRPKLVDGDVVGVFD